MPESLDQARRSRNTSARIPPHDLAAEESLLGALLLSAREIGTAKGIVRAQDFYKSQHGTIFQAIVDLYDAGSPADPITVADWLHRIGELERIGGPPTLVALQTGTPAISNAKRYAEIVVEFATLRNVLSFAAELADRAYGLDVVATLEQAKNGLADLILPTGSVDAGPDLDEYLGFEDIFDWVVPGLIEHNDRVILTGGEGKGKSHAFRQIAVQLAAGIRPFTQTALCDPSKVLYVDLENSGAQCRRKLRPLRAMVPEMDAGNLVVKNRPSGVDLLGRADQKWLTEHIEANRPDVLIIGPIYRMHDGDPTEERPARQVSRFLDELRERYGFALLLEAHSPHGTGRRGEQRTLRPFGASLWVRWPEIGIGLAPDDQDPGTYRLSHWRGARDERAWPTRLVRGKPGEWPWMAPVGASTPPNAEDFIGDSPDYVEEDF